MLNACRHLGVKFCFGKGQNARLHALPEQIQLRAALARPSGEGAMQELGNQAWYAENHLVLAVWSPAGAE